MEDPGEAVFVVYDRDDAYEGPLGVFSRLSAALLAFQDCYWEEIGPKHWASDVSNKRIARVVLDKTLAPPVVEPFEWINTEKLTRTQLAERYDLQTEGRDSR